MRLVIKNNKIKSIDSSLQFYSELTYIDLSYNHLLHIPQNTFLYQKKLVELYLNHNKIGAITNATFFGLSSLKILNLRGNFLDELGNNVFSQLKTLEELNIGQNRLALINPLTFEGLTNLRVLYLDDNALVSVPSASFPSLRNIAELYLGINSFTTIPNSAFSDLKGLNRLDLRGAALHNISRESFKGLETIRALDFSDNRMNEIPTQELSILSRLEELSFGQNDFETIHENAFIGLPNLKVLEITGSIKLKKIEAGAFTTNTNLETITISSNKALMDIQDGVLSGLPHLKNLILRNNAITSLSEGLFAWNELVLLDLSENPIICDCRMLWLRNILVNKINNSSQTPQNPIVCAAPERLREEQLQLLTADILGCSHTDPRKQAMICAALVATAATITALALITFRCRRSLRELLKGRWGNSAMGGKDRKYQKTFSEEDYMSRHHHQHPCSLTGVHPQLNNYQSNHHQSVRAIPVTEL